MLRLPTESYLRASLRCDRAMAGSTLVVSGTLACNLPTHIELVPMVPVPETWALSVVVTSTEVWRVKSAERRGRTGASYARFRPGRRGNLPADPARITGELSNIEQALATTGNGGARELALQRLAMLDTPASAQRLVQLYLVNSIQGEDWIIDSALRDSSQIDVIIPLLEAALSDPGATIPTNLPELLAYLQTRQELGVMPAYPSDPAKQREWTDQWDKRSEVRDKYFARAGALLLASSERRSGPQRATAIYQAWYSAGQLNSTSPEERLRLQSSVLAVTGDLNHAQQVQFVVGAWQTMPREQLLPLIRTLAKDGGARAAVYDNHEVFRLWCEGWAAECNAAILQDIVESNTQIDKNVILLMSETEHPELDEMLETKLRDPAMARDSFPSQCAAAVILRAGSRNIASAVDSYLDQTAGEHGCDGDTRGELLGYLFRVTAEDGGKRLSAELQDNNDSCGIQVLRTLHSVRPSDGLIPIVTNALNSPKPVSRSGPHFTLGSAAPLPVRTPYGGV